jgi:hypothetical protein
LQEATTVETVTYGSEFMVAQQCCEQIIDLRYTLCLMVIPIDGITWVFGDNMSVIISSTIPQSTLNKHHNALSYHCIHECVAAKIIYLLHVEGANNPSDTFTKALLGLGLGHLYNHHFSGKVKLFSSNHVL